MSSQPPSFQFYPQDFLSDLHIQSMTDAECGRYIKLLCHCWIEDGLEIGNPLVDRAFKKYPNLKKYFIEKNNKFFNSRLNKERKKQKRFHRAMKKAGITTAIKRWRGHSLANSQATDKLIASRPSSSSSSSSYRDNKEISIGRTQSEFDPQFNEFWSQYPKEGRLAKKESRGKFIAICKRGEIEEFKKGCLGYGDFLKHKRIRENFEQRPMYAKTFLNGRWREYIDFKYEAPL